MKIRSKFILLLIFLLIFIALGLWIGTYIFLKTDTNSAGKAIAEIIDRQGLQEQENEVKWIEAEIQQKLETLTALLSYIDTKENFKSTEKELKSLATLTMGYHPDISFVQIEKNTVPIIGIVADDLHQCSAQIKPLTEDLYLVYLSQWDAPSGIYIGKEVEKEMLALFDINTLNLSIDPSFDQVKSNCEHSLTAWADIIKLIQTLETFRGNKVNIQGKDRVPVGMVKRISKEQGYGLLGEGIFRTIDIPKERKGETPLIYDEHKHSTTFIYKSLEKNGVTLIIGSSLDPIFHFYAQISSSNLLIVPTNKKPLLYSPKGERILSAEKFDKLKDELTQKDQEVIFDNEKFQISELKIKGIENAKLYSFYRLQSLRQKELIKIRLGRLSSHLIQQISLHIILISGLLFLISLIIFTKVVKKITKPIDTLAGVTIEIAKGNYSVTLPPKGSSIEVDVLTNSFEQMIQTLKDKERIRAVLNKVVSKEIAEEILKSKLHLGGEEKEVTMLFSDIRDFTYMTQKLEPQKVIAFLNEYMTKMSQLIEGEGGIIDKFVGDEIMALYGVPTHVPDHTIKAISTGLLMKKVIHKWNTERKKNNEHPIDVGIGIHTGNVVAGNMGAEDRLNYTVIGSNVNLAARLCEKSKNLEVLVTEMTWEQEGVKKAFIAEKKGDFLLKGFDRPITVYEIKDFHWEQ